jgi:hypothetical protein
MRRRVEEADARNTNKHGVLLKVSRQNVSDLIEAFNQLNQMNPWHRGVARRLRDLAMSTRDALDEINADVSRRPETE